MNMSKLPPKQKKTKASCREELLNLNKYELVDKILQLEAHNLQLKNIINKSVSQDVSNETENKSRKFDFTKCHFRKIFLHIFYFGWNYNGLAVQEDSSQTIEQHLFNALTKACLIEKRQTANYHRCGRTDKGVSAFGQVISINIRSNHPSERQHLPESISTEMPYCRMLNRILPKDIRAVSWMPIPDDKPEFSARFDCKRRQYKYYFPRANLNLAAMRTACSYLIGSRDFRNLCKMDVGNGVTEFIREIFAATIHPVDMEDANPTAMYYLKIEANAFLWHQIRCIMAILLLIGQGKEDPSIVKELLDVEKYPRKPQYHMALDIPLNLFHCSYDLEPSQQWVYDKNELKILIMHLQNDWTVTNIKSTMMRDTLSQIETVYTKLCKSEANDDEGCDPSLLTYADCLIQGVKSKVYKPLLKRETCSSLEERIKYYSKKRKLDDVHEEEKVD